MMPLSWLVYTPSTGPLLEGDERIINYKLAEAVKLGTKGLNVSWEGLRKTDKGLVAADLIISEGGVAVKYNTYLLKDAILLRFRSTDRSRVELAERLLRHAGVDAEVKKEGSKDKWYVGAATDKLAAGRKELRKALAEIVKAAVEKGWVDAGKAEGWLEKLEKGLTLRGDWPKYHVGLDHHGSLVVRFASTDLDSIKQEAQRLREMGLKEGVHFTVKMPEEGRNGYVRILKDGLAYAAWLSIHGSGEQRRLAAEFVEYILQRSKGGRRRLRKSQRDREGGQGERLSDAKGLGEEGRNRGQGARGEGVRLECRVRCRQRRQEVAEN